MVKTPDWETSAGATIALLKAGNFVSADLITIGFTKQPGHAPTPPFNIPGLVAEATGAYSTRLLRTAYTGPALRVWRSTDNALQDIFFRGNGDLDTLTMGQFVSSNGAHPTADGRIDTWYDQSGNGNHLIPVAADDVNAAYLIQAGVGFNIGGHTALNFITGTTNSLVRSGGPYQSNTQGSIMAVANARTGGNGTGGLPNGADANPGLFQVNDGNPAQGNTSLAFASSGALTGAIFERTTGTFVPGFIYNYFVAPYTFATDAIFALRFSTADGTVSKGYVGGNNATSSNSAVANSTDVGTVLGVGGSSNTVFDGLIGEFFVFAQELPSTDANTIGNNQSAWWGPAWSNIS
jgi:Alpha-L-arabinofuranosidase B, catalytic